MKGLKRPLQSSAMDLSVVYGRGGSSSQEFSHGLPPPSAAAHYHEQCGAMGQDGGDFTAAAAAASAAGGVDSGNYWRVADKGRAAGVTAAGTAAVRAQPTAPVDLVVLNIDFTTKKEALVKYFEKFGKVEFA
ncbi:unnamed protein product, partial [Anisakis simplex]|uniref:RRM domain-containing protein n=1 Tax=Anisakis simplex TaxID=6269 RepID=A0A0M3JMY2_ANISI